MQSLSTKLLIAALCAGSGFIAIAVIASRFFQPQPIVPAASRSIVPVPPAAPEDCLPSGDGFLQARMDGAIETRLDWANAGTVCDGGPRPDGKGIRVTFTRKPPEGDFAPLLVVFGVSGISEGSTGTALPVNLTVIDEKHHRVFGTLGENKCTMDRLEQKLIGSWNQKSRSYRVTGRGFCMQPARRVSAEEAGSETLLMSSFDFAGKVTYP